MESWTKELSSLAAPGAWEQHKEVAERLWESVKGARDEHQKRAWLQVPALQAVSQLTCQYAASLPLGSMEPVELVCRHLVDECPEAASALCGILQERVEKHVEERRGRCIGCASLVAACMSVPCFNQAVVRNGFLVPSLLDMYSDCSAYIAAASQQTAGPPNGASWDETFRSIDTFVTGDLGTPHPAASSADVTARKESTATGTTERAGEGFAAIPFADEDFTDPSHSLFGSPGGSPRMGTAKGGASSKYQVTGQLHVPPPQRVPPLRQTLLALSRSSGVIEGARTALAEAEMSPGPPPPGSVPGEGESEGRTSPTPSKVPRLKLPFRVESTSQPAYSRSTRRLRSRIGSQPGSAVPSVRAGGPSEPSLLEPTLSNPLSPSLSILPPDSGGPREPMSPGLHAVAEDSAGDGDLDSAAPVVRATLELESVLRRLRSARDELAELAGNLGETFLMADLGGLVSHKRDAEIVHSRRTPRSARHTPREGAKATPRDGPGILKYKLDVQSAVAAAVGRSIGALGPEGALAIRVKVSILDALWSLYGLAAAPERLAALPCYGNLLFSDLVFIYRHGQQQGVQARVADLAFRLLSVLAWRAEWAQASEAAWRSLSAHASGPERTLAVRSRLDPVALRLRSRLDALLASAPAPQAPPAHDSAVVLRCLADYLRLCATRSMPAQIASVALPPLLAIKQRLLLRGKLSSSNAAALAPAAHHVLVVFDELARQCRHRHLAELLVGLFWEREDAAAWFDTYAGQILCNPKIAARILLSPEDAPPPTGTLAPPAAPSPSPLPGGAPPPAAVFVPLDELRLRVALHYLTFLDLLERLFEGREGEDEIAPRPPQARRPSLGVTELPGPLRKKRQLLHRLDFFLSPEDGVAPKFLYECPPGGDPQLDVRRALLRLAAAAFAARGSPFLERRYTDFYIRVVFVNFIKLYNAQATPSKARDAAALDFCRAHLQVLLAIARSKAEDVTNRFYQLRVMSYLVREIDLEFEITTMREKYVQHRMRAQAAQSIRDRGDLPRVASSKRAPGNLLLKSASGINPAAALAQSGSRSSKIPALALGIKAPPAPYGEPTTGPANGKPHVPPLRQSSVTFSAPTKPPAPDPGDEPPVPVSVLPKPSASSRSSDTNASNRIPKLDTAKASDRAASHPAPASPPRERAAVEPDGDGAASLDPANKNPLPIRALAVPPLLVATGMSPGARPSPPSSGELPPVRPANGPRRDSNPGSANGNGVHSVHPTPPSSDEALGPPETLAPPEARASRGAWASPSVSPPPPPIAPSPAPAPAPAAPPPPPPKPSGLGLAMPKLRVGGLGLSAMGLGLGPPPEDALSDAPPPAPVAPSPLASPRPSTQSAKAVSLLPKLDLAPIEKKRDDTDSSAVEYDDSDDDEMTDFTPRPSTTQANSLKRMPKLNVKMAAADRGPSAPTPPAGPLEEVPPSGPPSFLSPSPSASELPTPSGAGPNKRASLPLVPRLFSGSNLVDGDARPAPPAADPPAKRMSVPSIPKLSMPAGAGPAGLQGMPPAPDDPVALAEAEAAAAGAQPTGGAGGTGLVALAARVDPANPKFQLVLNQPAKAGAAAQAAAAAFAASPSQEQLVTEAALYARERAHRPLYADTELHVALLELVLALLLGPSGALERLYAQQMPHAEKKANVPFLLHLHLNHAANAAVVPLLAERAFAAGRHACRLARLLCARLFAGELYRERERIAAGAFGVVHRCRLPPELAAGVWGGAQALPASPYEGGGHSSPEEEGLVAVKIMDLPLNIHDRCVLFDVYHEIQALEELQGDPRACRMLDYGVDEHAYYLVMEAYGMSLKQWRLRAAPLPARPGHEDEEEAEARERARGCPPRQHVPLFLVPTLLRLFRQALECCRMLAARGVLHFDIKADNFLLRPLPGRGPDGSPRYAVVVADYGESKVYQTEEDGHTFRNRGTEFVKSPEMLTIANASQQTRATYDRRRKNGAGAASDVWSVGCLFYELLAGEFLFHDDDWIRFFIRLTTVDQVDLLPPERRAKLEALPGALEFLEYVLVRDPIRRPTMEDVVHRFDATFGRLAVPDGEGPPEPPARRPRRPRLAYACGPEGALAADGRAMRSATGAALARRLSLTAPTPTPPPEPSAAERAAAVYGARLTLLTDEIAVCPDALAADAAALLEADVSHLLDCSPPGPAPPPPPSAAALRLAFERVRPLAEAAGDFGAAVERVAALAGHAALRCGRLALFSGGGDPCWGRAATLATCALVLRNSLTLYEAFLHVRQRLPPFAALDAALAPAAVAWAEARARPPPAPPRLPLSFACPCGAVRLEVAAPFAAEGAANPRPCACEADRPSIDCPSPACASLLDELRLLYGSAPEHIAWGYAAASAVSVHPPPPAPAASPLLSPACEPFDPLLAVPAGLRGRLPRRKPWTLLRCRACRCPTHAVPAAPATSAAVATNLGALGPPHARPPR